MTKKLQLFCLTIFSSVVLNSQTPQQVQNFCGAGATPQQWDTWFNKQVEMYKQNMQASKTQTVVHVIPVIVHVVYFNESIGTYPNIDSNQIKSQIAILNHDFGGTGLNVGNVPSVFSNLVANTGIQFCLAQKDRQDQPLVPHGIDRVGASANSWQSPSTPTLDLQNYFNTVVIPATIWDPTKYLNIWISDKPTGYPLNGFATYPPASGLIGLFGGNFGTTTNDGIWVWAKTFGNVGTVLAPYDQGRTATHELGHWLGLRHIWGDGNCLSDYCNDTPWSKQAHYGCVPVPTPIDVCGVGQSPNGEMPMNFMDRSDDACMYMFTPDQNIRMQTALNQSSLRYQLGTHNKCAPPIAPTSSAVASFTTVPNQCLNAPFLPFNTSSGFPYPTYVWSSSPAAAFAPNTSVANPAITLSNPGFYTLTLVATNSLSSSTATFVVSAQNTCAAVPFCLDSIRMMKNVDSLTSYKAPYSTISGCGTGNSTGYLVGTNCYKDKEFAQFFPPNSYSSTPNPQVNSVIVLFDTAGTKAFNQATQVICKIYGGTVGQGPTSVQGQKSDSLGKIVSTPKVSSVTYIGKQGLAPLTGTKIYPFRFDFASPVIISSPGTGFFAGVEAPATSPLDSISILSDTKYNSAIDSTAWYLSTNISWKTYRFNRSAKIQLAIIPIITCGPVGIKEESAFSSNINIMPNPNDGLFSLVFTLPTEQQLSVNIYNSLGQQISSSKLKNVMNNVVNIDLGDKPNGIYMTEITNGSQKVVKKIIVSR
jgi:hypothetical protein